MRLLLSLLLLVFVLSVSAENWYVKSGFVGGNGTETSPFGDFQTAFNAAKSNDTILAAPGVYPSKSNAGLMMSFQTKFAMNFTSSSTTNEMIVIDFSDDEDAPPFLTLLPANDKRGYTVNMTHFKFTNQNTGNVLAFQHSVIIMKTCLFEKNSVLGGHCIQIKNEAAVFLNDVNFTSNGVGSNGPAINFKGDIFAEISNSNFKNNNDINAKENLALGGAVYISSSEVAFTDSSFTTNMGDKGGAVYVENGASSEFNSCHFTSNHANVGGAISAEFSELIVHKSDFFTNTAAFNGGAIYQDGQELLLEGCTLTSNIAQTYGGAIHIEYSKRDAENQTKDKFAQNFENIYLEQNLADYGGAVAVGTGSILKIQNGTFVHNDNWIRSDGKPTAGPVVYASQSSSLDLETMTVYVKPGTNILGDALYVEGGLFYADDIVQLGGTWKVIRDSDATKADLFFSNVSVVGLYSLEGTVELSYNASLTFCAFPDNQFSGITLTNGNLYLQSDMTGNELTWLSGNVGAAPQSLSCRSGARVFSPNDPTIVPVQLTIDTAKVQSVPLKTVNSEMVNWVFTESLSLNEYTQVNIVNGSVTAQSELVLQTGALLGDAMDKDCDLTAANMTLFESSVVYCDVMLNEDVNLYFTDMDGSAHVKGKFTISKDSDIITHYTDIIVPPAEGEYRVLSWEDYKGSFHQSYADYTDAGIVLTYYQYYHDGFYQVYTQIPPSPSPQGKKGRTPAILVFCALLLLCVTVGLAWFMAYRKRSQPATYSAIESDD